MASDTDGVPDDFDKEALLLRDRIAGAADLLREHCDSVVIIATISEGDSSQMVFQTRGNTYAVRGSIERFRDTTYPNP